MMLVPGGRLSIILGMVGFPTALEPLLPWLPRTWLNQMELRALPGNFGKIPASGQIRSAWSTLRVAFVKQALYSDLYVSPPGKDAATVVKSSLKRTGPMGFFTDLKAGFFMVGEDSAPECRVWEESVGSNPPTRLEDLALARQRGKAFGGSQVDEIPWNTFDVVISLDIAVPQRLIRHYPRVFWVYFPADPGTPTAKAARRVPPQGFDAALSHAHRRFPVRPSLGRQTVEFPYSFQSSFSWDSVWPSDPHRAGVMVENQTFALLPASDRKKLEAFGPIRVPRGSVDDVAVALRASKYYLRLQGGPLAGNGQIEAIMAGALAVGDPGTFVQRSLFTPTTVSRTLAETLEKIGRWEACPDLYRQDREQQLSVAEFICFRRPAFHLWSLYTNKEDRR